ncbi:MAG: nitrilotriacetate monooxygenase, partial [Burkholderiaceae bacterium]
MDSTKIVGSASSGAPDPRALRRVCGRFATGVAIIGACAPQGRPVGLTVNSFAS